MGELEVRLAGMLAAWTAGRPAADHAPAEWLAAETSGATSEPGLAAFAGRALEVLFRPEPPPDLEVRPLLPAIASPIVPEAQRSRVRRLLAARSPAAPFEQVVRLLAARGYVVHPADWMPSGGDDRTPEIYAPWIAWVEADTRESPATLTADNWDDWSWAERKTALAALRRRDPAAARDLIAARAGSEAADRRLSLLRILELRLGDDDLEVVDRFSADRSDRVRLAAARLSARLGRGEADPETTRELAEMVRVQTTGLLTRRTRLVFPELKTAAQRARRLELMRSVPFTALVAALETTAAALLEAAPHGGPAELAALVQCIAETGTADACERLLELLLEAGEGGEGWLSPLADRVPEARRRGALASVVGHGSPSLEEAVAFAGPALGGLPLEAVSQAAAWTALRGSLRDAREGDAAARAAAEAHLGVVLPRLALLVDRPAAQAVLDLCTGEGLPSADPRLDLLHLNAALETETTS